MSRFATLVESITAPGSFGPIGFRDLNPEDKRAFIQFESVNDQEFSARVYATLNFDFVSNVGSNWFDVTDRFRPIGESTADWVIVSSKYQRRKKNTTGLPISDEGLYTGDVDFIPAGLMVNVSSVSSGDALNIYFGV